MSTHRSGQRSIRGCCNIKLDWFSKHEGLNMCLGIPGKVTALGEPNNGLVMGRVDFGGLEREVCFGYTPEAKLGDYVLVHVGFALSVIDPESAQQILADLAEIERLGHDGAPENQREGQT